MSSGELSGRVAIVTGSGSGIGRAIALRFAAEGARVVVADIDAKGAVETVSLIGNAGGGAIALTVDIAKQNSVEQMVHSSISAFGKIDVLVNNAAIRERGSTILDTDEANWDRSLDVGLKGAFLCSRAVVPGMIERGAGVVLNIASVNGLTAIAGPAYSAGKAGLINLTKNMAIHFGEKGVRVNCIAPGTVKTPIWQHRIDADPGILERVAGWYPISRIGEPDDLAKAALFLCSDRAAWITGITLPVDGGFSAKTVRR